MHIPRIKEEITRTRDRTYNKLDKLCEIARAREDSDKQARQMEGLLAEVNCVTSKYNKGKPPPKHDALPSRPQQKGSEVCYTCGR